MARIGHGKAAHFGAVRVSMPGEIECGDSWRLARDGELTAAMVVDGLGHGPLAAQAANCSTAAFSEAPFDAPRALIERMHRNLGGTRGAAAACASVNPQGLLCYAGVGNISASVVMADTAQGLASHNGTLGVRNAAAAGIRVPARAAVAHRDAFRRRLSALEPGAQARPDAAPPGNHRRGAVPGSRPRP